MRDGGSVHVDGAFGIWAAASPRYAHLTTGFSDAGGIEILDDVVTNQVPGSDMLRGGI